MAAERMRKAKILFRDILDSVIDPDPAGGLPGSAASQIAAASKGETNRHIIIFHCFILFTLFLHVAVVHNNGVNFAIFARQKGLSRVVEIQW